MRKKVIAALLSVTMAATPLAACAEETQVGEVFDVQEAVSYKEVVYEEAVSYEEPFYEEEVSYEEQVYDEALSYEEVVYEEQGSYEEPVSYAEEGSVSETAYEEPESYEAGEEVVSEDIVFGNAVLDGCYAESDVEVQVVAVEEIESVENAAAVTGLSKDEDGSTIYLRADGTKAAGWKLVDGVWYYFDDITKKAVTGFRKIMNTYYIFDEEGAMQVGKYDSGKGIYFGDRKNGHVSKNKLIEDGSTFYYSGSTGKLSSGWKSVLEGWSDTLTWYFFDKESREAVSGFQDIGSCTYYFDGRSKVMQTGVVWVEEDDNSYYFTEGDESGAGSGHLVKNTMVELGDKNGDLYYYHVYKADDKGVLSVYTGVSLDDMGRQSYYENGKKITNEWRLLRDDAFWFNADGFREEVERDVENLIVNALRFLGVKEGSQEHHEIIDTYNQAARTVGSREIGSYSDAWCAMFVSACSWLSDLTKSIPITYNCETMISKLKNLGEWMEAEDSYVPKAGDVILYAWGVTSKGDNKGTAGHIGIVLSAVGDVIKVIEGNMTMRDADGNSLGYDGVGIRTISKGTTLYNQIRGYGKI